MEPQILTEHDFSELERRVIHGALLAQVDDVHAGGVYQWGDAEFAAAAEVLAKITGAPVGDVPQSLGDGDAASRATAQSLLVPVYDLDHPDLTPDEWDAAEEMLAHLSATYGR